jgi:hypothetical protein
MSLRILTSAVALSVVCVAVCCADQASGAARAQPAAAPACVTVKDMSETIVDGSERDLGGPYPFSIGGSSTYLDRLYTSTGAQTATVYGKANVPMRLGNGDLAEYSDELIEFADGDLEAAGFYDITQAAKGVWQYLPAVGISGRYKDMLGERHFRITKLGATLSAWIELCPAGSAK